MPKVKKTKRKKSTPQSQLEHVVEQFDNAQKNCSGYVALCPLHDDTNPSLSINEGDDGRILVHCHAGCATEALLEVVGLQMADLMPGAKHISVIYNYYDEHDKLLYQSLRYEPKEFRMRQPNPDGGWTWKMKGVRRVLYRWHEWREYNKSLPMFIVEGEKDVDQLIDAPIWIPATTVVGGAKAKWLPEYTDALKGWDVVLIPDNDPGGWERVEKISRKLLGVAKSLKILELPDLPKKGDVSDWLDAGGTKKELMAIVATTPTEPYTLRDDTTDKTSDSLGSKSDLANSKSYPASSKSDSLGNNPTGQQDDESVVLFCRVSGSPVEAFPVEVFPKPLQRFILSIAEALPCPPDFPGAMLLPVLPAFIGLKRSIEIKSSWIEHGVLWVVAVARSGERKSPAFEKVTAPMRAKQRELLARYLQDKAEYEDLEPDEQEEADEPELAQVLTTDTTIEALKDVLASNPNGILYPADELSGWVWTMSQYKGGHGDDRQHWLSIWSCMQIVCNRRGNNGPIIINDPFVSVTGGIQPDALGDVIDDAREDGFAARILFAYPDPIPNKDWDENAIVDSLEFAGICELLWDLEPSREPLTFSLAAKALWVTWVNAHRQESLADNLRPMWSKCEGHCARFALILCLSRKVSNETKSDQIDEPSISGAIKLIEYFKSHAKRVYGAVTVQSDKGRIGNALRWIKKQGGTVTARLANMNGLCKDSETAQKLFEDLAELGYGTVTNEARGSVVFRTNDPSGQQDNRPEVGVRCP